MSTQIDCCRNGERMIKSSSSAAVIQEWAENVKPETRTDLQAYFDIMQQYDISADIAICTLQQIVNTEGKEEEPSPYTTKQVIQMLGTLSSVNQCEESDYDSTKDTEVISNTPATQDEDSDADPVDDEFIAQLAGDRLQDVANEADKQTLMSITPSTSNLSKKAAEFYPGAGQFANASNALPPVNEEQELEQEQKLEASQQSQQSQPLQPISPISQVLSPPPVISNISPIPVLTSPPISQFVTTAQPPLVATPVLPVIAYDPYLTALNALILSTPVSSVPNTAFSTTPFCSVPNTNSIPSSSVGNITPNMISSVPNHIQPSSMPNQFDATSIEVQLVNRENNKPYKPYKPRQPVVINERFISKFNNRAKGNIYISKPMITKMTQISMEPFVTDTEQDEKLAFGYYKESVAMQINDDQINIILCGDNKKRIILNIDLHFKTGETMYLIAEENHKDFRDKVPWNIVHFMTKHEIYDSFGYVPLPLSSRQMPMFQKELSNPPNMSATEIERMLKRTNFTKLPKKTSKRKDENGNLIKDVKDTYISEKRLKQCCQESWNDYDPVPAVVIKGKHQCIEWKKFIRINSRDGNQYVGVSLRYLESNKKWTIECLDFCPGRVYYQYRLVGTNHKHQFSYQQLKNAVTTSLVFTDDRRSRNNRRNYYHNY